MQNSFYVGREWICRVAYAMKVEFSGQAVFVLKFKKKTTRGCGHVRAQLGPDGSQLRVGCHEGALLAQGAEPMFVLGFCSHAFKKKIDG